MLRVWPSIVIKTENRKRIINCHKKQKQATAIRRRHPLAKSLSFRGGLPDAAPIAQFRKKQYLCGGGEIHPDNGYMQNESQNIEYKAAWRDEYLKWICGFANAQGGKLYIGVNDKKEITGVADAHRLFEDIPNKVREVLGIMADVNLLTEEDREYIEVAVDAQNVPISYKGKYYYRTGSTNQELNGAALQRFLLKKMGRSWDDAPRDVSLNAIDREAIDYFLKKGIEAGRIDKGERSASTEQVLQNLGLIDEDGKLKNAALLLFSKEPRKYFAGTEFKIGKFGNSETELIVQDVVEDNLIQMTDKVVKILRTFYLKSYIRYEGMQRIETLEIPEAALREVLYNAIAHRDYSDCYAIQMRIFDDHIELWNDGELPVGYTQETLMRRHSSKPRNRNIAAAFFKAGFVEAWGRGYKTICDAFRTANLPVPTIENNCGGTLVTMKRPLGNPWLQDGTEQNVGINVGINPENVGINPAGIEDDIRMQLSERQLYIIAILSMYPELTVSGITEKLAEMSGKKMHTTRTIERDIAFLQNKDIIKREGSRKTGRWVVLKK